MLNWPAVRGLLERDYNTVFRSFANVENVTPRRKLSELKLSRQAGGFAFEYWCTGGDLSDIDSLIKTFDGILGKNDVPGDRRSSEEESQAKGNVISQILQNVQQVSKASDGEIWSKSHLERLALAKQWQKEIGIATLVDQAVELHRRHQAALRRLGQVRVDGDVHRFSQLDVIGMTTTACAKYWPMLNKLGLQTVICEEAGEVIEAHSLCTLFPTIKHAIFIGDPLQLRAQVNQPEMALENGKEYRLDQSLFERMMFPSLPNSRPFPTSRLNIQRRAHPTIANIMRATLYPKLRDAPSTHRHPRVAGMADRLFWLDHRHPEERPDPRSEFSTSFSNAFEVELIYAFVQYLVKTNEYNFGDIAVLTPYNGQLAALSRRFRETCSIWLIDKDKEALQNLSSLDPDASEVIPDQDIEGRTTFEMSNMLRVATIDNFQGEEAKIVILSTVRSNLDDRVGFLKSFNRINVACSRAKHGFYIIGNASLMQTVGMWRSIIDLLYREGKIGPSFRACCPRHPKTGHAIRHPEDFERVPVCGVVCGAILPCGHICKDKCHTHSIHDRKACRQLCSKRHEGCNHPCYKLCGEPCGECTHRSSSVVLPCGHTAALTCKEENTGVAPLCEAKLQAVLLPCGHEKERRCGSQDEDLTCHQPCLANLACGHQCSGRCADCQESGNHSDCTGQCGEIGDCGHVCPFPCHAGICPPCEVVCETTCAHSTIRHKCSTIFDPCTKPCAHLAGCSAVCCLPCTRTASSDPCNRLLRCGHLCPSLADERCPEACPQCVTGDFCDYLQVCLPCSHAFDMKTLDTHLGVTTLFEVTEYGIIEYLNPLAVHQLLDLPGCPTCGHPIEEIRRYSAIKSLRSISEALDSLYVVLGQKLNSFMQSIYYDKKDLHRERNSFVQRLTSGPLGGKTNESLVKLRGNKMEELKVKMARFEGKRSICT